MILMLLGWLAALGLLAVAVSSGWHGFRDRRRGWLAAAGCTPAAGASCSPSTASCSG